LITTGVRVFRVYDQNLLSCPTTGEEVLITGEEVFGSAYINIDAVRVVSEQNNIGLSETD